MDFEEIVNKDPYSLSKKEKEKLLTERLIELTNHHKENCPEYGRILEAVSYDSKKVNSYKDLPFLPVRLFKGLNLKSISEENQTKVMTSSGTTGQAVSKIYLDKITSANQQKAMVKIVNDFIGTSRMPMIIIDCPSVIKDRKMFSARGAGILGFSIFASKKVYALNDSMELDLPALKEFLENYKDQKIFLFGFTFMIWQYFYKELKRIKDETGKTIDLSNAVMIHGGGWKKLISEAVDSKCFHDSLKEVCGLDKIHDYYGMVEQTGCIYMECQCGHLHASNFSDVIIRNPKDFSECEIGEKGIMQVVSTIPESYPGHSLLTEDEGMILGEDDCPCGRKGKYFKILGRIKNAEIRGCSDTFAADYSIKVGNETKGITYLIGDEEVLKTMTEVPTKSAFDEDVLGFLNAVSKDLMRNSFGYADVVTLGFWLRKASLSALKAKYGPKDENIHMGRGIVFHIAPSNVAVNYAYSLFSGLLCGNANVVRLPSKDFPQVKIVNDAIGKALEQYPKMRPYICLVRYDRQKEINDFFSDLCDVRVIWGGDNTINEIRKSLLKPRATEITFADRYSLAVIDVDTYMKDENKKRIAEDFYNDTYLTDQNACTSPRAVVWVNNGDSEKTKEAMETFWGNLAELVTEKYNFQPIMAVDKMSMFYLAAADKEAPMLKLLRNKVEVKNQLFRIQADKLSSELMDYKGNCGFFYEYDCSDIMGIKDICNDTHCQTIGYIGEKEMLMPLLTSGINGVDRIVKVGKTMDFDLTWDGYNLVDRMTRVISV